MTFKKVKKDYKQISFSWNLFSIQLKDSGMELIRPPIPVRIDK